MPQYQGVWTLEQQAQAQSNQQWVTDPNFKNTTLLLQADGTGSGSQNNTFLDGSTNNFFITRNGNTTQGSFSPFSQAPGYWGNYLNGSSYLQTPSSTNYAFGTGDFTIEGWFYPTATTANLRLFEFSDNNDNIGANFTSTGTIGYYNGSTNTVSAGIPFTANQWNHVAVVRSSGTVTVYVNGTSALTQASTPNTTSARSVGIGGISNTWFPGYVSNVRILKGTALYTATFTPPTAPLTAITNTQLLTCQSNRFVDNSVNGVSFTIGSAPQVQAFGPFAPALQWTPDVVGGSGYFDGSDYLQIANNANLRLDGGVNWTLEAWVYVLSSSGYRGVITMRTDSNNTASYSLGLNPSQQLTFYNGAGYSGASVPTNTWTHLAIVRNGSTTTAYVNGVGTSLGNVDANASYNTAPVWIGANFAAGELFTGYISGARIVKGTAVYTADFTPPTTPPTAITNTALLINYTNAGIYDGTMANNLETVGNAQVSTSVVKYGSGSMYFDGNGDYLTSASTQSVAFGTGDFTVEMWVYPTTVSTVAYLYDTRTVNSNPGIQWYINTDATMGGGVGLTNVFTTAAGVMTANQWQHIAISKANGVWRIFRNGILLTSGTNTTAITDTGFTLCTAFNQKTADTTNKYAGFIDDFRITKGVARYIANFTPPQQALPRQ